MNAIEIEVATNEERDIQGEIPDDAGYEPMSKTLAEVISEKVAEIEQDETSLRKKKEMVNTLCTADGREPMYAIEDNGGVPMQIRSDQFYGQPLAASVRTILEMRKQRNQGAATIADIFEALTKGGFEFETKSDDISKKSLRNSLAKNTALFHKLPNGQFGLLSWYPNAKKPRATGSNVGQEIEEEEEDAVPQEEAAPSAQRLKEMLG